MRPLLLVAAALLVLACEPRKPGGPTPPIPKVEAQFNHERSTS